MFTHHLKNEPSKLDKIDTLVTKLNANVTKLEESTK